MVSLILLPPLNDAANGAPHAAKSGTSPHRDTAVIIIHNGTMQSNSLIAALTQYPKIALALHPVDAPLHTVTLPPLPASRRDAALRFKLEDAVLGDTAQLTLAVQSNANNVFHVSTVHSEVLNNWAATLHNLGHGDRSMTALAAHLPLNSAQTLGEWILFRDEQGAGAVMPTNETAPTAFNPSHLIASTSRFTGARAAGSIGAHWRWAMRLAALCVLVWLIGTFWQWRQWLALEKQAQQSIASAFARALPGTPMLDPLTQLQRAATGGNAYTNALAALPSDWPQASITQIVWANQRLSITANATVAGLDLAKQAAAVQDLATKNITLIWAAP